VITRDAAPSSTSPRERGAAVRFPFPPLLFALPLGVTLALEHTVLPWRMPGQPTTTILGAAMTTAGALFSVSGAATALAHRTTLAPHHPVSRLVTRGPFRISRNPMYAGLVVAYVGAALWAGTWWPLPLVPLCVLVTDRGVIRPEEAYLTGRFGPEYERYRSRVRRWI
jgi:protein-S-isoprenylcysteine O-methyltransferase Ste14